MREKLVWKPGTMLNPVPVVMVSVGDIDGQKNIFTVAWTGTICSDPAMVSISVRKQRFSHPIIMQSKKFVINLVSEDLTYATDWCGVKSGKDFDKFKEMKLTAVKAPNSSCPMIDEAPISLECSVTQVIELGTHDMFLAKIDNVCVSKDLIDPKTDALDISKAKLVAYSHGHYYKIGEQIGRFGFAVKKK